MFEIYGDYGGQPPESHRRPFASDSKETGANVRYHGRYETQRVDALMQLDGRCDHSFCLVGEFACR